MRYRSAAILVFLILTILSGLASCSRRGSSYSQKEALRNAADWIRTTYPPGKKVLCTSRQARSQLKRTTLDFQTGPIIRGENDIVKIPDGAILIWDSYFTRGEGNLAKDSLMVRKEMILVGAFWPETAIRDTGTDSLEILIFEKRDEPVGVYNYALYDSLVRGAERSFSILFNYNQPFEPPVGWEFESGITNEVSHSGEYAFRTGQEMEYGPTINWKVTCLPINGGNMFIRASIYVLPVVPFTENQTALVVSFERNGRPYQYGSIYMEKHDFLEPGKWHRITVRLHVPEEISSEDMFKVYIWHRGKEVLYCDDLQIELVEC